MIKVVLSDTHHLRWTYWREHSHRVQSACDGLAWRIAPAELAGLKGGVPKVAVVLDGIERLFPVGNSIQAIHGWRNSTLPCGLFDAHRHRADVAGLVDGLQRVRRAGTGGHRVFVCGFFNGIGRDLLE